MTVTNTIHISAAPDTVWAVTIDVERWPEWTPTVTSVEILTDKPLRLGSIARIKQPMQPAADWVVTEFVSGRRFAWETRRASLRMKGIHELSAEDAGTANVLRVEAQGILASLLWPMLRLAIGKALADENRGLKARCEAR
jgi:uncharacterized membrane protein